MRPAQRHREAPPAPLRAPNAQTRAHPGEPEDPARSPDHPIRETVTDAYSGCSRSAAALASAADPAQLRAALRFAPLRPPPNSLPAAALTPSDPSATLLIEHTFDPGGRPVDLTA